MTTKEWTLGDRVILAASPCCSAPAQPQVSWTRRDDMLTFSDDWTFKRCSKCMSIYLSDRPDARSLPAAYRSYYTHTSADDSEPSARSEQLNSWIAGFLNKRFNMNYPSGSSTGATILQLMPPARKALEFYGRNIPRSLCNERTRLLDVGCGNGEFLTRAMRMKIDAFGCEPDPAAAAQCVANGLPVIAGDAFSPELPERSFHYITLNHVIEHVEDPQLLLRRLRTLLRADGCLWLGLPNPSALGVGVFGNGWKGFHPPFHLLIPHQKLLQRWLIDAGFSDMKILSRGLQSGGMWSESSRIFARENGHESIWRRKAKLAADFATFVRPSLSEETIMIARPAA